MMHAIYIAIISVLAFLLYGKTVWDRSYFMINSLDYYFKPEVDSGVVASPSASYFDIPPELFPLPAVRKQRAMDTYFYICIQSTLQMLCYSSVEDVEVAQSVNVEAMRRHMEEC